MYAEYYTDAGLRKEVNQDSLCIKIAESPIGMIGMAVICDGMGGLTKGEVASAEVVHSFAEWFEEVMPKYLEKFSWDKIQEDWNKRILALNYMIQKYGERNSIRLGTTLSAILLIEGKELLIAQVGDSRIYEADKKLTLLTKDQTLVQRELDRGLLTEEQVELDPRQHILLQCIGESKELRPEFIRKSVAKNGAYILCSDGFRHKISSQEIYKGLEPKELTDESTIRKKEKELVERCKERLEQDNISVVVIRTY